MSLRRMAIVLGLLALLLPAVAAAQGLGDAAAQERAKRQSAKKAEARVFTNEDLERGRPAGTAGAAGEASTSPPSASSPATESTSSEGPDAGPGESASPLEERRAQEQPFQEAVREAQSRLAQVEARIKELQGKLNPMSTTFIYGDYNTFGTDKVAEETQVRAELSQAEAQLNEARQTVAAAMQALQDFKQGRPAAPPVVQ